MRRTFAATITLIILTIFSGAYFVFAQTIAKNTGAASSNGNVIPITVSDIEKAGFTGVQIVKEQSDGRFKAPPYYFQVSDRVASPASEAPNIVMVYSSYHPYTDKLPVSALYASPIWHGLHSFSIPGGTGEEAFMPDERVDLEFIKGNNYTIIIGPNRQKTEALALEIASKIGF